MKCWFVSILGSLKQPLPFKGPSAARSASRLPLRWTSSIKLMNLVTLHQLQMITLSKNNFSTYPSMNYNSIKHFSAESPSIWYFFCRRWEKEGNFVLASKKFGEEKKIKYLSQKDSLSRLLWCCLICLFLDT